MYRNKAQRDFARTLRNNPTGAEKHLWRFLRAQQLHGHKFRRQASIGPYTVDFICFAKQLIVELDGPQHLEPAAPRARPTSRRMAHFARLPSPPLPKPAT